MQKPNRTSLNITTILYFQKSTRTGRKNSGQKGRDIAQGKYHEIDFSKVVFDDLAQDFLTDYETGP